MNYQNEVLKNSKKEDDKNISSFTKDTIQYITNEYFDSLSSFITSNDTEKDKIMRSEGQSKENKINTIIRHDLDFDRHVNLVKVKQSILNNTNKGLTKFEKRARNLFSLYIVKMIEIYGMENLKENKSIIKNEIGYETFSIRMEGGAQEDIDITNKIGSLYGKKSITYINNLLKLEEYTQGLFEYSNNPIEKNKLKKLLERINRVKESLPRDVKIRLQKKLAKENIWGMGVNVNFDTKESVDKFKNAMKAEYNKILQLHNRIIKFKSIAFECIYGNPKNGYARIESIEERNRFNGFFENIKRKIDRGDKIDFGKSDFENELLQYVEEFKKIDQYSKKISELQNSTQQDIEPETLNKEDMLIELKDLYREYSRINKEMLIERLDEVPPEKIDKFDNNRLMLIHFMPTPEVFGEEFNKQRIDGINLANRIKSTLRLKISNEKGRKYNRKLDKGRLKELYEQARNPFDYSHRLPVKIQYMPDSSSFVLTKPTTDISMSIVKFGRMKSHLDRKIGIGILRSGVSTENIYTINSGYNLLNDRNVFGYHDVPISSLDESTNETMVDSTKIKIGYIIVVKDMLEFEKSKLYKKAKEISNALNLPLVVYDQYEIDRKKKENDIGER